MQQKATKPRRHVEQHCALCESAFLVRADAIRGNQGRYCSRACANQAKRIGSSALCIRCGVSMIVRPSERRAGRQFCGWACYVASKREALASGRFWAQVNKNGSIVRPDLGPCWLWLGGVGRSGYGRFYANGKRSQAHRFSWELAHGSVPDDRCVLHKCDVRTCVRPDHLWLGTRTENSADMAAKGRSTIGERDPMAILTAEQVRAIRARRESGMTMREAGEPFGATADNVWAIVHRKSWRHLE